MDKFLDIIAEEIEEDIVDEQGRKTLLKKLEQLKRQKLNIMFVGATGVGKSSTINAIFNMEIARVGYSVNPETDVIEKYELDNMILWDTPGLGDNPEKDKDYAIQIANALKEKDDNGELLIDEVVVVIDGSSRDMKTIYELIENVIAPYIEDEKRIVIAINQCDMALKGRYWNSEEKCPEESLDNFLNEKIVSVKRRIFESTGIATSPIFYSALYHYNISKLLLTMIQNMPETKRFLFAEGLNVNPDIWKKNDTLENYNKEIQEEVKGSLLKALNGAKKGAEAGAVVGSFIPVIGPVVGAAVGALLGFFGGFVEGE